MFFFYRVTILLIFFNVYKKVLGVTLAAWGRWGGRRKVFPFSVSSEVDVRVYIPFILLLISVWKDPLSFLKPPSNFTANMEAKLDA